MQELVSEQAQRPDGRSSRACHHKYENMRDRAALLQNHDSLGVIGDQGDVAVLAS